LFCGCSSKFPKFSAGKAAHLPDFFQKLRSPVHEAGIVHFSVFNGSLEKEKQAEKQIKTA
jgi:hypothetical protein